MPTHKRLATVLVYRSAITGRFVKPGVARRHPKTTIADRVRAPQRKK